MPLLKRIWKRSYSLNYLQASTATAFNRLRGDKINFHYRVKVNGETIPMNVTNADTDEVRNARRLERGEVSLEVWRNALAEFAALGRKYNFIPVVVYLPSAYTAYASSVVFEDAGVAGVVNAQSAAQRVYLKKLAGELHFTLFDTTGALQCAVDPSPLPIFRPTST